MQISYQEFDSNLLEKVATKYGEVAKNHIHTESGSFSFAAVCDDNPIGFISTYTKSLDIPINEEKDAYIDIVEVNEEYQRMGIASELVKRTEEWAKKAGLLQIRAWSSQDKVEAIPMWRSLGYGLCPAKIWLEWRKVTVDGYYVVKQLNPLNPYPNITKCIKQDIMDISSKSIQCFRLISAKNGVYVYKCLYDGIPAVVKYFEKEDDKREILNYRILAQHGIPTIKTFALGNATIVMEDITISENWRLGIAEDLEDVDVAKSLAQWYFLFHENGVAVSELDTLYFEYDSITEDNLKMLILKFPEATGLFQFLLTHYDKLRELIYKPSFTLTYNDFYWSNFVVRKDKKAAMMFDYNLLGKGYRFSDFRNVCWDMSDEAKAVFVNVYNQFYFEKHGSNRMEAEKFEKRIDEVAGDLFQLVLAFTEKEYILNWAEGVKKDALNGDLLAKAQQLLL
ncbi:MAG: GNAT family N-acetyltransferase [Lachnospiraceae bacterium]|jgi:GNAT superfamily N-acetyltransferase|nr:GNAT family N-acetyltransferase [Lachnospiraceae bacterium]